MRLIRKIYFLLTILVFLFTNICFAQLSLYAIHSDEGNHQFQVNRIGITSAGVLWMVYNSNANGRTKSMYSEDYGENWSADTDVFGVSQRYQPSLYIDSDDSILVSGTMAAINNQPEYRIRNGAWANAESVSDNEPVSYSQVLAADSNDVPFCVFRYDSGGGTYDTISAAARFGGSWQANVDLSLAGTYEAKSLSACMDPNDNLHAIWNAADPNYSIQTAYFNGVSWSAITELDSFAAADNGEHPSITNLDGTLIAIWSRKGVGTNNTKKQLRWAINEGGSSWGAVSNITDAAQNHYSREICLGNNEQDYYLFYSADEVDPNNSGVRNTAYIYYSGGAWSNEGALTFESTRHDPTSIVMNGNIAYLIITDKESNTEECGVFDTTRAAAPQLLIIQAQ